MKTLLITMGAFLLSVGAVAHDEGHGPKLTDAGKHGGIVTAVVKAEHKKFGPKAPLMYKAELLRMSDQTIRVFLYSKLMNPVDLKEFSAEGNGIIETFKKKKANEQPFKLALNKECSSGSACFMGKTPKPARKPFNIDIRVKKDGEEFLAAFDNLD